MINSKQPILMPHYMKKFYCIGSACEDTCCCGWRVDIDKETYEKYKKTRDLELKPIFISKVKKKDSNIHKNSYASIMMNKDGACPFLDENKLCNVQKRLGEKYLSSTCQIYPRHLNKVDEKLERSATISCPEVARLALLNPEGIVFKQEYEDVGKIIKVGKIFDTQDKLFYNKSQSYFWDIRIFSLSLLQNRMYSLADRLILLGIFYKRIEDLEKHNEIHDIVSVIESFNKAIEEKVYKEELERIDSNIEIQIRIAKYLIDLKQSRGIRYKECLEETLVGLRYNEEKDVNRIIDVYKRNYKEFVMPYLQQKEYILENYIVNEYFRELMPFGNHESIWDSYIFLCALYSMVKLHLVGMGGYHKGLTDELTIKLIQSFSKVVLHDRNYIKAIIELLKNSGFNSLAYMSILVKN